MKPTQTFGIFAAALVAAALPSLASAGCRPVSGTIDATVVGSDPVTVLGSVEGDLAGATKAVVGALAPNADGTMSLDLSHAFVTRDRATLATTDKAIWTPVAGHEGVFHMATAYTITGGTGAFDGASGTLRNEGIADTTTGLVTLRYEGEVCTG